MFDIPTCLNFIELTENIKLNIDRVGTRLIITFKFINPT